MDLDEIGIGGRHSEDGVEMGVVLEEDGDSGPVVLVHANAETLFHGGLAGDHDFLLAQRAEIVKGATQVTIGGIDIAGE